jgi:periplasmic divalent cation tolerance protein
MADETFLVLSTFPDLATAQRIGRRLVEEKCVACVNLLPAVESIYWWEGKVEEAKETLAFFKTTAARFEALQSTLRQLHPYEVPEIIALPIDRGLPDYLRWVAGCCAA